MFIYMYRQIAWFRIIVLTIQSSFLLYILFLLSLQIDTCTIYN
jgi:hypothetical protein